MAFRTSSNFLPLSCDVSVFFIKRQWLIISGPEAGHVWDDKRADYEGLTPLQTPAGERVTFYAWYRAWLDEEMGKRVR